MRFIDAAFVNPDQMAYVAMDDAKTLHIIDTLNNEEILRHNLGFLGNFLLSHAYLPLIFIGNKEGDLVILALKFFIVPRVERKRRKSLTRTGYAHDR